MYTSPANNGTEASIVWRVAFQKCGGKLYIHHMNLHLLDSGLVALQELRNVYRRTKIQPPYSCWDRTCFFWKPIVEVATLSTNSTHDLERQKGTRQVFVTHRQEDVELTAAFHDPQLLETAQDFVKANTRFSINNTSPSMGKDVLLIGLRMNWISVFVLVFLNIVVCLGSGIIVGYVTRRVDLGVAVTSGVAAVVACIQAVLVLLYK
ncbi:uncharacterized protein PAC_12976 [Phialocephala subalpina]|uniref:Uncharacterized protein n=1 Tax=Phialocephala subalpina TaxID=576137 RepID=A0A1L7XDF7_9HELO|nr:uncharacterized protein PAC_12976 [Phialocephala subalpina]